MSATQSSRVSTVTLATCLVLAACTSDGDETQLPELTLPPSSPPTVPGATTTTLPPGVSPARAALDAAQASWETDGERHYVVRFDLDRDGVSGTRTVTVFNHEAVAVEDQLGEPGDANVGELLTVADWFGFLDRETDNADRLQVVYDADTGMPIFIDHAAGDSTLRLQSVELGGVELTSEEMRAEVRAAELERTRAARERWDVWHASFLSDSYVIELDAQCAECASDGRQQIVVVNGEPTPESAVTGIGQTIDEWFDFIEFVLPNAHRVELGFDPEVGVPFLVDIDLDDDVRGDEFRIDLYEVIPQEPS